MPPWKLRSEAMLTIFRRELGLASLPPDLSHQRATDWARKKGDLRLTFRTSSQSDSVEIDGGAAADDAGVVD